MTMFGTLYPESYTFKYPKAGEENSVVSVRVYDLETGKTVTMDTGPETDQYIARISWTADPEVLSMLRLNRLQNRLDIMHARAGTGESAVVYSEENMYYISEPSDQSVTYLPDAERAILISERDGFYHLYLLDYQTGNLQPITTGRYDIDAFLGYDPDEETLYYTSYEESPVEKHLYSIRIDGSKKNRMSTDHRRCRPRQRCPGARNPLGTANSCHMLSHPQTLLCSRRR